VVSGVLRAFRCCCEKVSCGSTCGLDVGFREVVESAHAIHLFSRRNVHQTDHEGFIDERTSSRQLGLFELAGFER
jgi:hypothetical protein